MTTIIANAADLEMVAGFNGRIAADLVSDGGPVAIPDGVGTARDDQMQGTDHERLVELAGRVCYDSLGTGRSSRDYHTHLLDVGHWSVHEHPHATIELKCDGWLPDYLPALINRPGIWVRMLPPETIRVTLNPRVVMEWDRWSRATGVPDDTEAGKGTRAMGQLLTEKMMQLGPAFYRKVELPFEPDQAAELARIYNVQAVTPEDDHEKWVTIYTVGSRGFSHELVRHGDETAISQRSTRYVDESESGWVAHPLIAAFLRDTATPAKVRAAVMEACERTIIHARSGYDLVRGQLEAWLLPQLTAKGDPYAKTSARKQARGAARGLLGNALETELIFSGSVAQFLHMLNMRAADAADAEIRLNFAMAALPHLRLSRWADRFAHIQLTPASDGLGMAILGGGHK